jgi:hypothetical protein
MKRLASLLAICIAFGSLSSVAVLPARPALAAFTDGCSKYQYTDSNVRRLDAQAYATVAQHEGYEWGGGCWNDNNKDDTPSAPDSNGEGPDCSGFVFKTWELRNTSGDAGFTWYQAMQNIHGVYTTYDFHAPVSSDPFSAISKSSMMYMDAFAKNGHVAMLWTGAGSSVNSDYVIEALGDAYGTNVYSEAYRSDSAYTGAIREGWTPDCWPTCKGSPRSHVVVVP